jgi:hypothetical protein
LLQAGILLAAALAFAQQAGYPWPESDFLEPADLAKTLRASGKKPTILCVAFPVLYRSKHIVNAIYAGPGNRPEGIEALKKAVVGMPKDADIVLYCGCCPFDRCPNIRPAYKTLKDLGFTKVRVLNIPTNMSADWYEKGYPSEAGPAGVESPQKL